MEKLDENDFLYFQAVIGKTLIVHIRETFSNIALEQVKCQTHCPQSNLVYQADFNFEKNIYSNLSIYKIFHKKQMTPLITY